MVNARAVRKLNLLVIWLWVDVVHTHLGVSEIIAAMATPRGIPIEASRRGQNLGVEAARVAEVLQQFAHRRVAMMLCNSEAVLEFTRRHDLWLPPIMVIHNAVDLDRFAPSDLP